MHGVWNGDPYHQAVWKVQVTRVYKNKEAVERHCREVIHECMNIVECRGDAYVAIHKDAAVECVVLVAMLHTNPVMTVIAADKLLFSEENESEMFKTANDLNIEDASGWHTLVPTGGGSTIYMYRRSIWMTTQLTADELTEHIYACIAEYRNGRRHLERGPFGPRPCA